MTSVEIKIIVDGKEVSVKKEISDKAMKAVEMDSAELMELIELYVEQFPKDLGL